MQPRYGTTYEELRGKLTRIVDRTGCVHAELAWQGDRLTSLAVAGAVVRGEVIRDPLLGDAQAVGDTVISAIDWARPTQIPTVADPARLPAGAGGMILNVLALLAARVGVPALRYAGPYPTAALWRSLLRSFRATATEAEFTHGVLDRALRVARDELPIDFAPAPFERVAHARGWVELRGSVDGRGLPPAGSAAEWRRGSVDGRGLPPAGSAAEWRRGSVDGRGLPPAGSAAEWRRGSVDGRGLPPAGSAAEWRRGSIDGRGLPPAGSERAVIDGVAFELCDGRAEIRFGDTLWAHVATFDATGALVSGPHPIPACTSDVIGRAFPAPLRAAIADLVADAVPAPLVELARAVVISRELVWADLGARAAGSSATGFVVHAALWERVAPHGLARLALALAEALAPVVTRTVIAELPRASVTR